jgi:hypothetical protein
MLQPPRSCGVLPGFQCRQLSQRLVPLGTSWYLRAVRSPAFFAARAGIPIVSKGIATAAPAAALSTARRFLFMKITSFSV